MRLKAALEGDLKAYMAAEVKAATQAVGGGIKFATDGLKEDLRGAVTRAGLGEKLAKSWRGDLYPRNGLSINAAGFVYTRAPEIVGAFAHGANIRGKSGNYLAIPTSLVPRRKGRRMTPKEMAEAGQELVFIPPRGARRVGLLVLNDQRLTAKGRARKASDRAIAKGRVATVIMFILVPQVTLRKRFDIDVLAQKWIGKLPELVNQSWPTLEPDKGKT